MRLSALALLLALPALPALRGEEGMWTLDNLPLKQMKARYGFTPDQAWLDHLRLSVLRFPGATGSFVSADGLVLTNHHVARGSAQRVSTPDNDLVKKGFVARTRAEEIPVPGLELDTLEAMEDVTAQVEAAVKPGLPEKQAARLREQELERLKDALQKKTGLTAEAVSLYNGGQHWIYSYRKHRDVRLVMVPEVQLGAFGGDPDNFTYPRHGLDMALFRVYENGQPYRPAHHLAFAAAGLKTGDFTAVLGHPGGTDRQHTVAQMRFARDTQLPLTLKSLAERKAMLLDYARRSPEHARQVNGQLFGIENSAKALAGELRGLKDAEAFRRIEEAEKAFQAKAPALKPSWERIAQAMGRARGLAKESQFVGTCQSTLLRQALLLVRLADERQKPSAARLPEFSDASLPALERRLAQPAPFHPELELHQFAFGLRQAARELGAAHPFVKAVLQGRSPEAVAEEAVKGSRLQDPAVRQALAKGGRAAIQASTDPMIRLALRLDPLTRSVLRSMEEGVQAVVDEHASRIAKARFRVYGTGVYPDATFTLRLSYGAVEGYRANGTVQQPFTTFAGLFDRAWGHGPEAEGGAWALPARWLERRNRLELSTPLNFVHSVDTIGGNSGSPVVDAKGRLVGLLHDGNIEGLAGNYYYDAAVNRSISLDARAILEALDKVYEAPALVDELRGR